MNQNIAHIALIVDDYDKAIEFYTRKLNFDLVEDTILSETKRWVIVRPKGQGTCSLLLAKAANEEQKAHVGDQTGGRVFLFLYTDDIWRDYNRMTTDGVSFTQQPRKEAYGTVVVFKDLYGNLWDLVQPATAFKTQLQ